MNRKYIFVVQQGYWDYGAVVMATSDFRKAFKKASEGEYIVSCCVEDDDNCCNLFEIECDDIKLELAINIVKEECGAQYEDVGKEILPILENKHQNYLDRIKNEELFKQKKKIEKELKLLEELKAKYESH